MKKYIALDIGGTALKYGIVDEFGNVLSVYEASVSFDQYKTPILDTVIQQLDKFIENKDQFEGIAVSATGQINVETGEVIGVGGNIKNYLGTKIKKTLEERYQLKTTVINDANAVAAAEKWIGAGSNHKNIIAVTIGTGVGGGIYVQNEMLLGYSGIAGEIGHFSISKDGKLCTCGKKGCFEQYASMTALVKTVNESLNVSFNGRDIFENYDITKMFIQNWIDDIASGISSLIHIFNPEKVIVGGGVSNQQEKFIKPLIEKINAQIMPRFQEQVKICKAKLENNAGMVGAVYYFKSVNESIK